MGLSNSPEAKEAVMILYCVQTPGGVAVFSTLDAAQKFAGARLVWRRYCPPRAGGPHVPQRAVGAYVAVRRRAA